MTTPQQPHGPLRSFGRLKARPLKARQAALFDSLLPRVAIPADGAVAVSGPTWLEIGFGETHTFRDQARQLLDVSRTEFPGALGAEIVERRVGLRAGMTMRGRQDDSIGSNPGALGDERAGAGHNRLVQTDEIAGDEGRLGAVDLKHHRLGVEIGGHPGGNLHAIGVAHHAAERRRDDHLGAAHAQFSPVHRPGDVREENEQTESESPCGKRG